MVDIFLMCNQWKTVKLIKFSSTDDKSFEFTTLLHTYFRLPDVTQTTVSGLGGSTYVDKVGIYIIDIIPNWHPQYINDHWPLLK